MPIEANDLSHIGERRRIFQGHKDFCLLCFSSLLCLHLKKDFVISHQDAKGKGNTSLHQPINDLLQTFAQGYVQIYAQPSAQACANLVIVI